jgi:UDPglucose 6-dehydrogenase
MTDGPYELADDCYLIIINTEWNEFRQLDLNRIRDAMKTPMLFDGRNIYDPGKMSQKGFRYRGVGRGYNNN